MNNKKGITLMELLAYITIVSIVVVLLTSTMTLAIRSYDKVNGQGALNTEANFIMSNLMTKAFAFNPVFAQSCGTNCVDLVIDKETVIDYNTGILKEVSVDKHTQIRIDENTKSIYIGGMKLNNDNYAVEAYYEDENGNTIQNITYSCSDNKVDVCQQFVLNIRLAVYRINKNGERISDTAIYENRFSI